MKHKILTIVLILFVYTNYSYAGDEPLTEYVNEQNANENVQEMPAFEDNIVTTPASNEKIMKFKKHKRMNSLFKKAKKRFLEKFRVDNILAPQRILALMIVGFALLLPGMILALLGVALIAAIVLAVVGGTLFIIGVLAGK